MTTAGLAFFVVGLAMGLAGLLLSGRGGGRGEEMARMQRHGREISSRIRARSDLDDLLLETADGLGQRLRAQVHVQPQQGAGVERDVLASLDSEARDALAAGSSVVLQSPRTLLGRAAGLRRPVGVARCLTPVVAGSETLAVISAQRSGRSGRFTEVDVALMESVAWSLSRALLNLRVAEQQVALRDRHRDLDRTKSDFVSAVSHELRTPLTSIAGYLEILEDGDAGPTTADQRQILSVMSRSTARLQALIEDLLQVGRIEAGAEVVRADAVDLRPVVDEVRATMLPLAVGAGLSMDVQPVPETAVVTGDAHKLGQVLLNLVGNAVKFTPRGGRVTVSTAVDGQVVVWTVTDTGIGIPEHEIGDLFTRFFRASNATAAQTRGAGLGLSIVAGLVEAHGGNVAVSSFPEGGTTVRVELPRLAGPTQAGRNDQAGIAVG